MTMDKLHREILVNCIEMTYIASDFAHLYDEDSDLTELDVKNELQLNHIQNLLNRIKEGE